MTQTNITDAASTLLAQFEQWAQLEPDRCRVDTYSATPELKAQSDIALKLGDSWFTVWATAFASISNSGLAILQAALQEAIVAKGWDMSLHFTAGTDGEAVGWIGEVDIHRLTRPSFWQVFHEAAAIALLTAYLQALRAERAAA
jgi:hypothetical protein